MARLLQARVAHASQARVTQASQARVTHTSQAHAQSDCTTRNYLKNMVWPHHGYFLEMLIGASENRFHRWPVKIQEELMLSSLKFSSIDLA